MSALSMDGKSLAGELKSAVKSAAKDWIAGGGAVPQLAVLQVAGDAASDWYVRSIKRSCASVHFGFEHRQLAASTTQAQLETAIREACADPAVHGVLVQMPLPKPLEAEGAILALDPIKDVDGLHPMNAGRLAQGLASHVPNTPAGGVALLDHYQIELDGKHAVVVGRSNVVGKPMAHLLLARNATVSICHSRTTNLAEIVRQADVVIAAVGRAGLIDGSMLKPGATVIDFGINVIQGQDGVVGDVDYLSALEVAGAITPVPGGTGPVTNVMLLQNLLQAAQWTI